MFSGNVVINGSDFTFNFCVASTRIVKYLCEIISLSMGTHSIGFFFG